MQKYLASLFFLFISTFTTTCWGEILEDATGNRFITIGSTKDEVLEILGTPRTINTSLNWWYYGYEYLSFDASDRVKEYTDSEKLKILLLPSSKKNKTKTPSPNSNLSNSISNISNSSPPNSSTTSVSTYIPKSSGYGEISEKTGRAKTVSVKGYTRKDGTYVKPHYRSPPKRK